MGQFATQKRKKKSKRNNIRCLILRHHKKIWLGFTGLKISVLDNVQAELIKCPEVKSNY